MMTVESKACSMLSHLCRFQRLFAHHLGLRACGKGPTQGAQRLVLDAAIDDRDSVRTFRSKVNCLPYRRRMSVWTVV